MLVRGGEQRSAHYTVRYGGEKGCGRSASVHHITPARSRRAAAGCALFCAQRALPLDRAGGVWLHSPAVDLADYEQLNPARVVEHDGQRVVYLTPNRQALWRVESLFSKEPDTIEWIASFAPEDVLADIGANVGMYTIWAAKTRGTRVFAFEPEAQNYALLNRNIHANGLDRLVRAWCVALSDASGFDALYLSDLAVGGSCHSYGAALDFNNAPRTAPFAQGAVAVTLDEMVARGAMSVPQHVKIDVDGLEHKVMAGARQTLAHESVRSVLVEVNTNLDEHWDLVDLMVGLGFDYSQEQVARAQRTEGTFKGVGNYVFRR